MSKMLELHLPQVVVGGRHLTYYVAIGSILTVVWLLQRKKKLEVDVPFYKAAKTKWMFDSETQILDSYRKVRLASLHDDGGVWLVGDELLTGWSSSSGIEHTRSKRRRAFKY